MIDTSEMDTQEVLEVAEKYAEENEIKKNEEKMEEQGIHIFTGPMHSTHGTIITGRKGVP